MTRPPQVAVSKAGATGAANKGAPDLSTRIKEICRSRGLSLRQLAAMTGIPVATLSKVQNNLATLSYVQLTKLAGGLGIELNELFTTPTSDARTGRRAVTHKGQGLKEASERFDFEILCAELANRSMNPAIMEVRARTLEEAGGLIAHEGEEFAFVLTGAIEIYSEDYVPTRLESGACIYIDSTSGHAYVNVSDEPVSRVIAVTTQSFGNFNKRT